MQKTKYTTSKQYLLSSFFSNKVKKTGADQSMYKYVL